MQNFNELKELVTKAEGEAEAFYNKGTQVAGTRLRNLMLSIKQKAQDIRVHVSETKNNA